MCAVWVCECMSVLCECVWVGVCVRVRQKAVLLIWSFKCHRVIINGGGTQSLEAASSS